jgi:hypothetical protein
LKISDIINIGTCFLFADMARGYCHYSTYSLGNQGIFLEIMIEFINYCTYFQFFSH